jgi:hypothetical protein
MLAFVTVLFVIYLCITQKEMAQVCLCISEIDGKIYFWKVLIYTTYGEIAH